MTEIVGAAIGIALGVVMLRYWRVLARASAGPGVRGPETTMYPAWIVRIFAYAILGAGAVFVLGGIGQIIAVLVT